MRISKLGKRQAETLQAIAEYRVYWESNRGLVHYYIPGWPKWRDLPKLPLAIVRALIQRGYVREMIGAPYHVGITESGTAALREYQQTNQEVNHVRS